MYKEIWKDIEGFEGLYQISNFGKVKSLHNRGGIKERILKPYKKKNGYLQVKLRNKNHIKYETIHRLVAQAFLPNPTKLPSINHKDENKENNNVDNLEWCSVGYNNTYGSRIESLKRKLNRRIKQYDLEGKFIKEYESVKQASQENNISMGNISSCAKGRYAQTHNYVFKYAKGVT